MPKDDPVLSRLYTPEELEPQLLAAGIDATAQPRKNAVHRVPTPPEPRMSSLPVTQATCEADRPADTPSRTSWKT